MIDVGASGTLAEVPFSLYDGDGAPVSGYSWTDAGGGLTAQVQVFVPGGSFTNATIANIVSKGNGQYALQLTAGQTATPGKVYLYVSVASHSAYWGPEEIVVGSSAAAVVAALVAYAHDTGATVGGLLVRLEAFLSGQATNMHGPTTTWYKRGGGIAFAGVNDVTAGNRAESDISGSEP